MSAYWITFENRGLGCVTAPNAGVAYTIAEGFGTVLNVATLPNPATPRLNPGESDSPSFCYLPHRCAGRTSCQSSRSCTD